jgi:hypothetical protein
MILRVLAFAVGLLATAGAYAQTCTIPYTLTNGTIAGQVAATTGSSGGAIL